MTASDWQRLHQSSETMPPQARPTRRLALLIGSPRDAGPSPLGRPAGPPPPRRAAAVPLRRSCPMPPLARTSSTCPVRRARRRVHVCSTTALFSLCASACRSRIDKM